MNANMHTFHFKKTTSRVKALFPSMYFGNVRRITPPGFQRPHTGDAPGARSRHGSPVAPLRRREAAAVGDRWRPLAAVERRRTARAARRPPGPNRRLPRPAGAAAVRRGGA